MYLPKMPIEKSWIPPKNSMTQMVEVQPATGSENISFLAITKISIMKAIIEKIIPITVDICKGNVVNANIPSMEYFTKPQKDHVDSP